jgi:hypothetical protein
MATQHNTFIRKFGKHAVVITVTDWEDFKELEALSDEGDPDFLVPSVTTKSIYSNNLPNIVVSTHAAVDITKGTQGAGLAQIITGGLHRHEDLPKELEYLVGGIWSYKNVGLTYSEEESKPTF